MGSTIDTVVVVTWVLVTDSTSDSCSVYYSTLDMGL